MSLAIDDLMASSDIAEMAGVERPVVSNWKKRYKGEFPKPVTTIGGRTLYDRATVVAWLKKEARRRVENAQRTVDEAEYALATAKTTLGEAEAMWDRVRSLRGPRQ